MGICTMCVQYVCETSPLQFTEKKTKGVLTKSNIFCADNKPVSG